MNEIIEQGEWTDPLDPDEVDAGQFAHYYWFQEIVCGENLVNVMTMKKLVVQCGITILKYKKL